MLHSIDITKFGPLGEPMAHAVQACVHCGFCLAACPTYQELGQEMDTPRGKLINEYKLCKAAEKHSKRCCRRISRIGQ
jgi:Fe-S oxidoreductase